MTMNDMQSQIEHLKSQNNHLVGLNEELRQKLADHEAKGLSGVVSSAREETFGNLPTGLSARSPQLNQ